MFTDQEKKLRTIDVIRERAKKTLSGVIESEKFNPLNQSMEYIFPSEFIGNVRTDLDSYHVATEKITQRQWCRFGANLIKTFQQEYKNVFFHLEDDDVFTDVRFPGFTKSQIKHFSFKVRIWYDMILRLINDHISLWPAPNQSTQNLVPQIRSVAGAGMKIAEHLPELSPFVWQAIYVANAVAGMADTRDRKTFISAAVITSLETAKQQGMGREIGDGVAKRLYDYHVQWLASQVSGLIKPNGWDDRLLIPIQSNLTMVSDLMETPSLSGLEKASSNSRGASQMVAFWIDQNGADSDTYSQSLCTAVCDAMEDLEIEFDFEVPVSGSWIVERILDRVPS